MGGLPTLIKRDGEARPGADTAQPWVEKRRLGTQTDLGAKLCGLQQVT